MLTAPEVKRVVAPEGTFMARVVGLIHIGTYEDEYMGDPIISNKIRLTFELPDEKFIFKEGEEPRPFVVSQEYSLSMGEKANLRKVVEGIVGKLDKPSDFDVETLMGKECIVTIKHKEDKKGGIWPMISSTSPLMKGQVCPMQVNKTKVLTYEKWDESYFQTLPKFIKEKMETTVEFKKMKAVDKMSPAINKDNYPEGPNPDDIPF